MLLNTHTKFYVVTEGKLATTTRNGKEVDLEIGSFCATYLHRGVGLALDRKVHATALAIRLVTEDTVELSADDINDIKMVLEKDTQNQVSGAAWSWVVFLIDPASIKDEKERALLAHMVPAEPGVGGPSNGAAAREGN